MSITSTATVATDRPERFAKQLVTHLGRKVTWTTVGNASTATFGTATAGVATDAETLTLTATGKTDDEVALVENVLGSHLERFAFRHPVEITWTRTTTEDIR